jgi:hypothetical protein
MGNNTGMAAPNIRHKGMGVNYNQLTKSNPATYARRIGRLTATHHAILKDQSLQAVSTW